MMESRTLAGVLAVGLILLVFGLVFWLMRFPGRLRAEYRPPFGISGPLDFFRLDLYSDRGRTLVAKAAGVWVTLSFSIVTLGLLAAKFPSTTQPDRAGAKTMPPEAFFVATTAMFGCSALVVSLISAVTAAFQLASPLWNPSARALCPNATRLAIYGVGAFLLAVAHLKLLSLGPGLLK